MWSLIRGLLVAGNLFFLVLGSGLLWEELTTSERYRASDDLLLSLAIVVLVSLNLYFLTFRAVKGSDWLALWMKRKKLEEEKRIKDLEEQTQN